MNPITERIKKLLSLAQSENQNESQAALAKAAALAAEHDIDMSSIVVGAEPVEPMVQTDYVHRVVRRRPVEHRFISQILMSHYKVDIVWGFRGEWHFIGRKSDTEFASWLCGYLIERVNDHWTSYRKAQNLDARQALSYRNTFVYGWHQGLKSALERAKSEVVATKLATPEARGRYELVVLDESKQREVAKKTFFPRLGNARSSSVRVRDHGVMAAGRSFGSTVTCNRPLN